MRPPSCSTTAIGGAPTSVRPRRNRRPHRIDRTSDPGRRTLGLVGHAAPLGRPRWRPRGMLLLGCQRAADMVGRRHAPVGQRHHPRGCPCGCATCPDAPRPAPHHHAIRVGESPCLVCRSRGVPPAAAISRTRCAAGLAVLGVRSSRGERAGSLWMVGAEFLSASGSIRSDACWQRARSGRVEHVCGRMRAALRRGIRPVRVRACPMAACGRHPCTATCCPPSHAATDQQRLHIYWMFSEAAQHFSVVRVTPAVASPRQWAAT